MAAKYTRRGECGDTRTARWPTTESGIVLDAPHENWNAFAQSLRTGLRGLPGGTTLAKVVRKG